MMGCVITYFQQLSSLTPQECIEKLREIEMILEKMQDRYSKECSESKNLAVKYAKDDQKVLAKACLRRCKMLESQMANISARRAVCEQKRFAIEQINSVNMQVSAMQSTARTFKVFLKQNDLDRIQDLQENLQQAIIDTCDINEALSEELPLLNSYDEGDLEDELRSLMLTSEIQRSFPSTPEIHAQFPEVPTSPLHQYEHRRNSEFNQNPKRLSVGSRVF